MKNITKIVLPCFVGILFCFLWEVEIQGFVIGVLSAVIIMIYLEI